MDLPGRRGRPRDHLRRGVRWAAIAAVLLFSPFAYRLFAVYRFDLGGPCPEPADPAQSKRAELFGGGSPPGSAPPRLKILNYNIEGHAALFRPDHLGRIADVLRAAAPDLAGVEEVNRGRWVARFADQARDLARLTGMQVCFGPSFREFGGEFGNALLTRGKIVGARTYPLPSFGEPRSVLRCDVDLGGRRVTAFVAHLASWGGLARSERRRQVQCLAGLLRSAPYPVVLLGDLNATPEAVELAPLLGLKTLSFCGKPAETTYPSRQCRLDYLLVGARWKVLSATVLREGPSDHWPATATLGWP